MRNRVNSKSAQVPVALPMLWFMINYVYEPLYIVIHADLRKSVSSLAPATATFVINKPFHSIFSSLWKNCCLLSRIVSGEEIYGKELSPDNM